MKWFKFSLILLILPVYAAFAQTVYTWEDSNGVLHFGDEPQAKEAKKVVLSDINADAPMPKYASPTPIKPKGTQQELANQQPLEDAHSKKEALPALTISLTSPTHDDTIRSNRGDIKITGALNRKIGIGEQLQLLVDGHRYGAPVTKPNWHLTNIDRGSHTLSIQAYQSGKLIASSEVITIHLHRASVK